MQIGPEYTLDSILERHDREFQAFRILTEPEKAKFQLRQRAVYATNPWKFLRDCVNTLDQVDHANPIKPFPSYLEYTEFLAHVWQKYKLMAIPKSRRMTCSWLFISLYTHDALFNQGRFNGFVSKKEDDAGELVGRSEFIYHKIPEWRIPNALLPRIKNGKMSKQPPTLEFEDINSKIQGFPQGADQLRQFTLSGILGDECAFWEQAQSFYSASKPTIDGGGRMTLISSRSPGFFKKIVFDRLDEQDLTFKEVPPVPVKKPMEGIEIWQNPKNKFVCIDLHYTADPRKRSTEWRDAIRASLPIRDFLMEYERSWQTFEGKPVYEDFNRSIHVKPGVIEAEPGIPLLLGWDFGLTPACLICQLVGRQLRILEEHLETNGSIDKLAPVIWNRIQTGYRNWTMNEEQVISFIDPAGMQKVQTDESTCAQELMSQGFRKIYLGPMLWEPRKLAVNTFITKIYSEGPALLISEDNCPILIEGFGGGYRYPEKALEIEPIKVRPLKNKYSHPHDALQYVASGALTLRKTYDLPLDPPTYSFQGA